MIYREEDFVLEVELVSREPKKYGNADGEEFTLKILKILRESNFIKKEALGKVDDVFTVWRSNTAGGYCSWYLTEY